MCLACAVAIFGVYTVLSVYCREASVPSLFYADSAFFFLKIGSQPMGTSKLSFLSSSLIFITFRNVTEIIILYINLSYVWFRCFYSLQVLP